MALLVGDLLDSQESLLGGIQLHTELVDVHKCASDAIEATMPLNRTSAVLENCVDGDIGLVEGDGKRITQCLANLVGNSMMYTKEGYIR